MCNAFECLCTPTFAYVIGLSSGKQERALTSEPIFGKGMRQALFNDRKGFFSERMESIQ